MDGSATTEVDDAYPDGWYVRVMFDELLDPQIEELSEILDDDGVGTGTFEGSIAATHPVTLQCQSIMGNVLVNVDYDGYYSPSGNSVTWPLGPSLVIKPNDPTLIATSKECQITLSNLITDKDGNEVPMEQRGPYKFRIAPIKVIALDPADDPDGESPIDALYVYYENIYAQFNTEPDPDSFCDEGTAMDECEFEFGPEIGECSTTGAPCEVQKNGADCTGTTPTCDSGGLYSYTYYPSGAKSEFGFGPNTPVQVDKDYTFSFKQGSKIKDRCGNEFTFGAPSVDDLTLTHYTTDTFKPRKVFNIADGETASMLKKLSIQMNNVVDLTSLATSDWTLTPALTIPAASNTACTQDSDCTGAGGQCRMFGAPTNGKRCVTQYTSSLFNDGDWLFRGYYSPDTEYTFTLKAGAKVKDYWGVEYTNASEQVVHWKTSTIKLGTVSPADLSTVGKSTATSATSIVLPFNQDMDVTSLDAADYTIMPAVTLTAGTGTSDLDPYGDDPVNGVGLNCTAGFTSCSLRLTGVFAPGDYTFTLKAGAVIKDKIGNDYTQATDKIIHFTVEEDPPSPSIQCL